MTVTGGVELLALPRQPTTRASMPTNDRRLEMVARRMLNGDRNPAITRFSSALSLSGCSCESGFTIRAVAPQARGLPVPAVPVLPAGGDRVSVGFPSSFAPTFHAA